MDWLKIQNRAKSQDKVNSQVKLKSQDKLKRQDRVMRHDVVVNQDMSKIENSWVRVMSQDKLKSQNCWSDCYKSVMTMHLHMLWSTAKSFATVIRIHGSFSWSTLIFNGTILDLGGQNYIEETPAVETAVEDTSRNDAADDKTMPNRHPREG
ncbi:hypothetical protein F442_08169 [Phytophthora nicotianae P10297]|uniref:Uncharacterized protein n=1 Tax=Phytophthora nicotianae P10297 TaxID=1317064 RepID=W2ZDJ1_PHYNI|nr:hypothetical protein F442_08169 [Phytophthora nicotianae P10297]